ncbi:MAG TPA: prepilin-type N-terminal cleavage/methylation domain-containing protein [candidate division Zixibacteria bacterium]|nr:prepilin-type N-terminal cleavage/methylation domain-containing protein [candidate division Zixibacteria bacterium]MDM7974305.1 prepilin-type N-terminal cleavage/methylation domain-containing protein [candidate division Zixibacteria bacterium]HOD66275.1 prepilin-type N-terminal cleavage/methylation domain-containing protein [candidate division Zixibacteria bacterium]HPC11129.1 prepilin-type N-terminal cleavage/methylation domain-containing protein [candidate division Zixibacteria bacterium]H
MNQLRNRRGFTLIELVIIIVILGILAAVAIPKYQDLSGEAREASARSALGSMRSAVTIFYANQAVQTGTATWPSLADLQTRGTVMAQGLPPNPYQSNAPDSVVDGTGQVRGTVIGNRGGWVYDPVSGELWANTDTHDENEW